MVILVGCECSQIITIELRKRGHEAYSCDLQPAEGGYPDWHIQADVLKVSEWRKWDMAIFHPPCTHLAASGATYFEKKKADGRQQEAIDFFMALAHAPIPKIAIENPVGIMSTVWRQPDQIIQPYEFGHRESKKTCLWLKNLPMLQPTKIVDPLYYILPNGEVYRDGKGKRYSPTHYLTGRSLARYVNQTRSGCNKLPPSADRAKIRSRTYPGIARAIAKQWTDTNRPYQVNLF